MAATPSDRLGNRICQAARPVASKSRSLREAAAWFESDLATGAAAQGDRPEAHVSVRSGHSTGKSAAMAAAIWWKLECFDYSKVPCTAPSAVQLRDIAGRADRHPARRPGRGKRPLGLYARDLVRLCEARFGKTFHPASLGRLLKRLGFSRQKARPSHPQEDPALAEAFRRGSSAAEKKFSVRTKISAFACSSRTRRASARRVVFAISGGSAVIFLLLEAYSQA
jgi:hypothetical protein